MNKTFPTTSGMACFPIQLPIRLSVRLSGLSSLCLLALLSMTGLVISDTSHADEIIIPIGQQGQTHSEVQKPERGWSQAKVLEQFGEPQSRQPARGTPPISVWHYDQFSVYFEGDPSAPKDKGSESKDKLYVIHSVSKHQRKF